MQLGDPAVHTTPRAIPVAAILPGSLLLLTGTLILNSMP